MKPVNEMKYSEAAAELEQILTRMQSNQCDIDQLAAMTRRAGELLTHCRALLTTTESELQGILAGLQQQ